MDRCCFRITLLTPVLPNQYPFPVYDEYGLLVGGASACLDNVLLCFLSTKSYPAALSITSGECFYVAVKLGITGYIEEAVVSTYPLGPDSQVVCPHVEVVDGQ